MLIVEQSIKLGNRTPQPFYIEGRTGPQLYLIIGDIYIKKIKDSL